MHHHIIFQFCLHVKKTNKFKIHDENHKVSFHYICTLTSIRCCIHFVVITRSSYSDSTAPVVLSLIPCVGFSFGLHGMICSAFPACGIGSYWLYALPVPGEHATSM